MRAHADKQEFHPKNAPAMYFFVAGALKLDEDVLYQAAPSRWNRVRPSPSPTHRKKGTT